MAHKIRVDPTARTDDKARRPIKETPEKYGFLFFSVIVRQ
jgi:hypothetical protein